MDWWALGCVIYEMLHGFPPFYGNGSHTETYKRLTDYTTGAARIHFPPHWTTWVVDLISGLLRTDASQRFGSAGAGGVAAIKAHSWFQGLDWDLVAQKRYIAPHRPSSNPTCSSGSPSSPSKLKLTKVTSQEFDDLTRCFDSFNKLQPMQHAFSLTPEDQAMFAEF